MHCCISLTTITSFLTKNKCDHESTEQGGSCSAPLIPETVKNTKHEPELGHSENKDIQKKANNERDSYSYNIIAYYYHLLNSVTSLLKKPFLASLNYPKYHTACCWLPYKNISDLNLHVKDK